MNKHVIPGIIDENAWKEFRPVSGFFTLTLPEPPDAGGAYSGAD